MTDTRIHTHTHTEDVTLTTSDETPHGAAEQRAH